MTRTVAFVPDAAPAGADSDLRYVERLSRNRGLHVLVQDASPARNKQRTQFSLGVFRRAIELYVATGRIEHPLPILRRLAREISSLARGDATRVDDFRHLAVCVLLQNNDALYVLCAQDCMVRIRRADHWEALLPSNDGVRELPVATGAAQTELFSRSVLDFINLYRVDLGPVASETEVMIGGSEESQSIVANSLEEPGTGPVDGSVVPLRVSRTVLWCSFARGAVSRGVMPSALARQRGPRRSGVVRRVGGVVAVGVALAAAYVAYTSDLGGRLAREKPSPAETRVAVVEGGESGGLKTDGDAGVGEEPVVSGEESAESPPAFEAAWSRSFSRPVTTSPVIHAGAVIFGSRDGRVYAYDAATGAPVWRYDCSGGVGASPVLSDRGVVVADYNGDVALLAGRSGKRVWRTQLGSRVVGTPSVGDDEVVIGTIGGAAFGLSLETGRLLWKTKTGNRIRGGCAYRRGKFFVPSADGYFYALVHGTGRVAWKHPIGSAILSTPHTSADRVIFGADDGRVYALECERGERVWSYVTGAPVRSFIWADEEIALAGSNDHRLYCLDVGTGAERWRFETGASVFSRAAISGQLVFIASYDRNVYCIERDTGAELARFPTSGAVYSSPAIGGRRVFVGNNDGRFYALGFAAAPTM